MKKSVLFMTAALCFGAASAQAPVVTPLVQAPALTDVPAGHWAKDAVQRLVSQGIILGYPDGTYRGNENLTRYEAAMIINRLLNSIDKGVVVVDDLDDTTLVSLRNAIDELSAQGADFEVRLADLEANAVSQEDFARLEGRVDALATTGTDDVDVADQLATVNEMATLLNQDVLQLQDRVATVEGDLATFDARLGLVEDQVTENTRLLDGQGLRIADLENGRVKLTLGVDSGYGNLDLIEGDNNFDVDRLTNNTFAKEVFSDDKDQDDDEEDIGDVDDVDTEKDDGYNTDLTIGIKAMNFDAGKGLVIEEAGVNFGIDPSFLLNSTKFGENPYRDADDKFKLNGSNRFALYLSSAEATGHIGDDARFRVKASAGSVKLQPDVINPVSKLTDAKGYNDYLLPAGGRNGVAAGLALTDIPLKPTLYVGAGYGDKENLKGPWFSVRTEAKLANNFTAGLSFVQNNAPEETDLKRLTFTEGRTAFGADIEYKKLKPDSEEVLYGAKALYVASMYDAFAAQEQTDGKFSDLWDKRDQAALITAEANFFNLGADLTLRAVSPGFVYGNANMDVSDDDSDATPKYTNEIGARLGLATKVGKVELGAFGDTYTNYNDKDDWSNRKTAFGAHAGVNLNAFRVVGFGAYATENENDNNDKVVDFLHKVSTKAKDKDGKLIVDWDEKEGGLRKTRLKRADIFKPAEVTNLYEYTSSVGALVTHDGSEANALVPNLNLALADNYFYDSNNNLFSALASYDVKAIKDVTVTPFVGYSRLDYGENDNSDTALKYGVDLETKPFAVAFKPSFKAAVGAANYMENDSVVDDRDEGSEIGAKVEVSLNEFFAPSTKLSLGYGFHRANYLAGASDTPADFSFGAKGVSDMVGNENTQTQGVFTKLAWNDALKLYYGIFFHDENINNSDDELNIAQGFKVNYGVKF